MKGEMEMRVVRTGLYVVVGGLGYGLIEVIWRGRTHWTMLALGGVCFLVMGGINRRVKRRAPRYALCALSVTALELLTGCLVNLGLGWAVWDYSARRFNLWGQICPLYSFLWLLLSIPVCALATRMDRLAPQLAERLKEMRPLPMNPSRQKQ